ncbi:MAG: nucleotidyltransferase family protein [Candidatus Omnitrophota bacterium]
MKALILAAGYATRLYPLTLNKPKPLLNIGAKTITDRLMEKVGAVKGISEVYIVTNNKFSPHFEKWVGESSHKTPIKIVNDRTFTNETRLGAVGDMDLVISSEGVDDDLLVLGGDNLFEFDLTDFIKFARTKGGSAVALLDVGDIKEARKYGIANMDHDGRVTEFEEKPKAPKSTLAALCVYYFPKEKLKLLKAYIDAGMSKDQPGYYISWLSSNDLVYGYKIEGEWFDIGDKRLLDLADEFYKKKDTAS